MRASAWVCVCVCWTAILGQLLQNKKHKNYQKKIIWICLEWILKISVQILFVGLISWRSHLTNISWNEYEIQTTKYIFSLCSVLFLNEVCSACITNQFPYTSHHNFWKHSFTCLNHAQVYIFTECTLKWQYLDNIMCAIKNNEG